MAMKTFYSGRLLLAGLTLLAAALPLWAADGFPIHVYPCPQAAPGALQLDGKLDEAAWQQAPLVSGFTDFGKDTLTPVQTSFRALWDQQHLYFGIRCEEPEMEAVALTRYATDEHAIFRSETIELFIDPNHTHSLYYQLAFNLMGSLYDGEIEATVWNSGAIVKADRGADYWAIEIAVPWGALRGKPEVGKVVGFNVSRNRNVREQLYSTWAQLRDGFHDPQRFAHLVLSGTPEMIGKLTPEFRKGERSGAITVFSSEGFSQRSYAELAAAAFAQVDKLLADLEAERQGEPTPAAQAEIKKRLDAYATRLAGLKAEAAGTLDAARWTRVDLALQGMVAELARAVWEARVTALLDAI